MRSPCGKLFTGAEARDALELAAQFAEVAGRDSSGVQAEAFQALSEKIRGLVAPLGAPAGVAGGAPESGGAVRMIDAVQAAELRKILFRNIVQLGSFSKRLCSSEDCSNIPARLKDVMGELHFVRASLFPKDGQT